MTEEEPEPQDNSDYDFYKEVMQITKTKWKELDGNEADSGDFQEQTVPKDILHDVRRSKEYMMEFVLTVTDLLGSEMSDPSPYLHTCKYVLQNFDTFEAMEEDLYSRYGDSIYFPSIEETDLDAGDYETFLQTVLDYSNSYVNEYMDKLRQNTSSIIPAPSWMQSVFQATLLIMLELELEYVAFFDIHSN